jgi:hypothetical protein
MAEGAGTAAPSTPSVELTGIIVGPIEREAFLQRPNELESQAARLGTEIDGWKITAIDSQSITLTRADRSVEIRLPAPDQADATSSMPQ